MDYKETILSNKDAFLQGADKVAQAVGSTMGPNGHTVILSRWVNGFPKITKDGVSVAKTVWFEEPTKQVASLLLRQAAEKTVEEAGDGTTTAIVLANALLKTAEMYKKDYSLTELNEQLDSILISALANLDNQARPLTEEKVVDIASISANNRGIGETVAKAVNFSTNVRVKESNMIEDSIEAIDGMVIKAGIFDNAFINSDKDQSIAYDEALFVLSPTEIRDYRELQAPFEFAEKNGLAVIVMAPHFSDQSILNMRDLYNKNILKIGLLKTPGFAEHRVNLVKDIQDSVCYKTFNSQNGTIHCGKITNFKANKEKTLLTLHSDNENNLKIINKVNDLREALKGADEFAKSLLQQRIDMLDSKVAIINVGGSSELEMQERFDRMEDAVLATKCALEEGFIPGAGNTLYDIACMLEEELPLAAALKAPYTQIRVNGVTIPEEISNEDLIDAGIIDPVKVTKSALKNAVSVARGLINSKYIVL